MQKHNPIAGIALGSFIGLLIWQSLFLALKFTDIIDWTWLWVFVPIWISMCEVYICQLLLWVL
jgi:hypothetical protein